MIIHYVQFQVFYFISAAMLGVLVYDFVKTYVPFFMNKKKHDTALKVKLDKIQSTINHTGSKSSVLESK